MARFEDLSALSRILCEVDINEVRPDGELLLHTFIRMCPSVLICEEVLQVLRPHVLDANAKNARGETVLDIILERDMWNGEHVHAWYVVVHLGASVNQALWRYSITRMNRACIEWYLRQGGVVAPEFKQLLYMALDGRVDQGEDIMACMLILLMERGGQDPNFVDNAIGRTTLHCAAARGLRKAAGALLDGGADPCAVDAQGRTPAAYWREVNGRAFAELERAEALARERALAFAMGTHARLGEASAVPPCLEGQIVEQLTRTTARSPYAVRAARFDEESPGPPKWRRNSYAWGYVSEVKK
jgi:hypothetical protein